MQIHELNRRRQIDEGVLGAIGTAIGHSVAKGAGYDLSKNSPTASAGILDPKQKLAAVMREPAMVKQATEYADEWLKLQAQAVPEAVAVPTPTTAPAKTTGTAMPLKPFQVPGAGTNLNPTVTKPGQTATTTTVKAPPAQQSAPAAKTANFAGPSGYGKTTTTVKAPPAQQPATSAMANAGQGINNMVRGGVAAQQQEPAQQQPPADPQYVTAFLKWANQKVAMRDKATYRTLGLVDAEKSDLGKELAAAKQKVISTQGDPATTKEAVKKYILTALAALQLTSSKSAVKAASPEAPAYGEVGDQAAAPGQTAGAGVTTAGAGVTPDQITGLLTSAGLNPQAQTWLGSKLQGLSQNNRVNSTGDTGVDNMLKALGYTVS